MILNWELRSLSATHQGLFRQAKRMKFLYLHFQRWFQVPLPKRARPCFIASVLDKPLKVLAHFAICPAANSSFPTAMYFSTRRGTRRPNGDGSNCLLFSSLSYVYRHCFTSCSCTLWKFHNTALGSSNFTSKVKTVGLDQSRAKPLIFNWSYPPRIIPKQLAPIKLLWNYRSHYLPVYIYLKQRLGLIKHYQLRSKRWPTHKLLKNCLPSSMNFEMQTEIGNSKMIQLKTRLKNPRTQSHQPLNNKHSQCNSHFHDRL